MDIVIRGYTTDDKTDVIDIAAMCGQEPCSDDPKLPNVRLVACVENRIAGYICGDLKLAPDPETGEIVPVMPWEGYILHLAVRPEYRHKGIGRKLLVSALCEYRKLNCVRMELCTGSIDSANFYLACGGTRCVGSDQTHPDGQKIEGGSFYWPIHR